MPPQAGGKSFFVGLSPKQKPQISAPTRHFFHRQFFVRMKTGHGY
jgi:hypothetical protein